MNNLSLKEAARHKVNFAKQTLSAAKNGYIDSKGQRITVDAAKKMLNDAQIELDKIESDPTYHGKNPNPGLRPESPTPNPDVKPPKAVIVNEGNKYGR